MMEKIIQRKLPEHVAIIMDGNGRWAQERGLPRIEGHKAGAQIAQSIIELSAKLGIAQLTLYCLSTENWKRPQEELDALFTLLVLYLHQNRDHFMQDNLKLHFIGRRNQLPKEVLAMMDEITQLTANNTGLVLRLAINYGGRAELVDAIELLIQDKVNNKLTTPIQEETISSYLYTAGYADPDLLIRTGNENRLSNFLLWQASYAEIWFSKTYWPDFNENEFRTALDFYATKERRFGGINRTP